MSTRFLLLLGLTALAGAAPAQKGNNQLRLMAEAGFPEKHARTGPGVYMKGLYGVGRSGQLSLTAGSSTFEFEYSPMLPVWATPVLVGYRFNTRNFYLEPQAGYGQLRGHHYVEDSNWGDWYRYSAGAVYFSLGGGYEYKRWEAGIRLQSGHATEDVPAASWPGKSFRFAGVHVGYALWTSHPRSQKD